MAPPDGGRASSQHEKRYYEDLGVPPDATKAQIKSAVTRLARLHHPDRNPAAAPEIMHRINQAADVLLNPDKRRAYDEDLATSRIEQEQEREQEERRRRAAQEREQEDRWRRAAQERAEQQRRLDEERDAQAQRRRTEQQALVNGLYGPVLRYARERSEVNRMRDTAQASIFMSVNTPEGIAVRLPPLPSSDYSDVLAGHYVVEVLAEPGYDSRGFVLTSPLDGSRFDVRAGLRPGRHVVRKGYGLRGLNGATGDLVLDYRWPSPVVGEDVATVVLFGRAQRRKGIGVVSPATGDHLHVSAPVDGLTVPIYGQGGEGEFGGRRGDLYVTLRERRSLLRTSVDAVLAAVVWVVNAVSFVIGVVVIALAVLFVAGVVYYLWSIW